MKETPSTADKVRSQPDQTMKGRSVPRWSKALIALILIGFAAAALNVWSVKEVYIVVDGASPIAVETTAWRVADALREAGITLQEGDEVTPGAGARTGDGRQIIVTRGRRVTINVDGKTEALSVAGGTVRDALIRADIRMGSLDRVIPVRETPLKEGMEIAVIRVTQEEVTETEVLPYRTVRWAEPHLAEGRRRLVQDGEEGLLKKRVQLTYENGELAHRDVLSHEVVEEAVSEIVGVGTRESVQVLETAAGTYHYVGVKDVIATAYYPGPESTGIWADGFTYTGIRAGRGVVAVDPSVIPLGTKLYVPGYGEAIAADIGGAIKGNRIDLGFETYDEAINYGRKAVKVYILAP